MAKVGRASSPHGTGCNFSVLEPEAELTDLLLDSQFSRENGHHCLQVSGESIGYDFARNSGRELLQERY
jgi:hypothetical protein